MNSDIYDHLDAYGLAKYGEVARRLAQMPECELSQFLTIHIQQASRRCLAISSLPGNTDIYPDSWDRSLPLNVVKQLAIYANRIYLHDPLLELAHTWKSFDFDLFSVLQRATREEKVGRFLLSLARAIEEMLVLRPLVEAGIVYFTPTFLVQKHQDPRNIYLDDFYGLEGSAERILGRETTFELPPAFTEYIRNKFKIIPARISEGDITLMPSKTLTPRRAIALYFESDPAPRIQLLSKVQASDEKDGIIKMCYPLGEEEPEEVMFWNWVQGTKHKIILERLERLQQDIELTALARAKFLTSLSVSKDLLELSTAESKGTDIITALLKMELPYFEQATFSSIAQARQNEVAFEDFRSALNKAFREINNLSSPQEIQERIDEISRDLLRIPVTRIEQRMGNLRRNLFPEAVIALGTLVSTIIMQGSTLVGGALLLGTTIVGGNEAFKTYRARQEEKEQIKNLPSFFYWDITHQRKQRHKLKPVIKPEKLRSLRYNLL